jgi:phosphoribosylanthranilate isomerase
MPLQVKVCGLTQPEGVEQAVTLGAAYLGFIFYPPSPRHLDPARARELAARVPTRVATVGVLVDPSDGEIDAVLQAVPLDFLQLHGHETPERVAALALRSGCRVIKALRVEEPADFGPLDEHATAADLLLLDAKPPRDSAWPGGHGLPFDWHLLAGRAMPGPWALAGGLRADNLEAAVRLTGAPMVDVSSGVESGGPGVKDPAKLAAFFAAARRLAETPLG